MITRQGSPFGFDAPLSIDEVAERIDTAAGDIATRALVIAGQIARVARLTKAAAGHARSSEWDIAMILLTAAREQYDALGLGAEQHGVSVRWLERAIDGVTAAMTQSQGGVAQLDTRDALGSIMSGYVAGPVSAA